MDFTNKINTFYSFSNFNGFVTFSTRTANSAEIEKSPYTRTESKTNDSNAQQPIQLHVPKTKQRYFNESQLGLKLVSRTKNVYSIHLMLERA